MKRIKPELTTIQIEFIKFLKSKRLYSAYCRNVKEHGFYLSDYRIGGSEKVKTIEDVFNLRRPIQYINIFQWGFSKEDFNRWYNINEKWQKVCQGFFK